MNFLWKIPNSWKWSTMGEISNVVGGGTPKTSTAEYFGGNVSWITPADLSGYTSKTISHGARNITTEGLNNSGARLMPAGTVLFSSRAPCHHRFKNGTVFGVELVDGVARLCCMNLVLHGIGDEASEEVPVQVRDSLAGHGGAYYGMVLTNPPFGKKSSVTVVNGGGQTQKESLTIHREDFWATTSNKQLNFVQHVYTLLKQHGRAAIVVPDNVLFEGGAGETVRRKLLHEADVHTLLRLPTGVFYAQGVKANVLFFDRKPASATPWTQTLWIYDLRTNMHFTLKENPLKRSDLDDFVARFHAENRHERSESGRFRRFAYDELLKRDKVNLDIFWLKDESLEDSANLPDPDVIAKEIVEDLEAALEQFAAIAEDLKC